MTGITRSAAPVALALAAFMAAAPAAVASGSDDVVRRGSCTGATHWKLKAGPDDGRLEVEGEIDSNRNGQTWAWRLVHNGSVSAHGTGTTRGPSGSFGVERRLVDLAGRDTLVFRARNPRSGEVCRGTVRV
jgi:hypothetical protein